ncbi:MAG TPA: hypothetical protein VJX16_11690 [Terriglobales bacterium]|nr:hypothetical protein [Terriglobales bacterium]
MPDPKREMLRHTVATLAYRGGKAIRGAPSKFAEFRCGDTVRTPGNILAHLGDLLDWALSMANGKREWHDSSPQAWDKDVDRLFSALKAFDDYLASDELLQAPVEKLFQGPIADALSHVGQIAMLRRVSGTPIRGENYYVADITAGRVGSQQSAPKREFD